MEHDTHKAAAYTHGSLRAHTLASLRVAVFFGLFSETERAYRQRPRGVHRERVATAVVACSIGRLFYVIEAYIS